jgi:hypothetical protein
MVLSVVLMRTGRLVRALEGGGREEWGLLRWERRRRRCGRRRE